MDLVNMKNIPGLKMTSFEKNGTLELNYYKENGGSYKSLQVNVEKDNSGSVEYLEGNEQPFDALNAAIVPFTCASEEVIKNIVRSMAYMYLDIYDLENTDTDMYKMFIENQFIVMYDTSKEHNLWGRLDQSGVITIIAGVNGMPKSHGELVETKITNGDIQSTILIDGVVSKEALNIIEEFNVESVFQKNKKIYMSSQKNIH